MAIIPRKIIWAEGILLGQQHLQQWDLYQEQQRKSWLQNLAPSFWGISKLEINEAALKNGTFQLLSCEVMFRDKTLIQYDSAFNQPLSCRLTQIEEIRTKIYIGMPLGQTVSGITGYDAQQQSTWRARYDVVKDLYDFGREREVLWGEACLSIYPEQLLPEDCHALPIAEVLYSNSGGYCLNPEFIPPVVDIKLSKKLQEITSEFMDMLTDKIGYYSSQSSSVRDTYKLLLLQTLTTTFGEIKNLEQQGGTHPQQLFVVFLNLVYKLRAFNAELITREISAYKHDQQNLCFANILFELEKLLEIAMPQNSIEIPLSYEDSIYSTALIDKDIFANSDLFLTVFAHADSASWIDKFTQQITIGTTKNILQLINVAMPGLVVKHMQLPPAELQIKPGFEYFYLDANGNMWDEICKQRDLAIFVPEHFSEIKVVLTALPKQGA